MRHRHKVADNMWETMGWAMEEPTIAACVQSLQNSVSMEKHDVVEEQKRTGNGGGPDELHLMEIQWCHHHGGTVKDTAATRCPGEEEEWTTEKKADEEEGEPEEFMKAW